MIDILVKSGAVVSSAGIALFVTFVIILLIFPVIKTCNADGEKCVYSSTAPEPFHSIVQPSYLAISLLTIAAGVLMVRYGRWREARKT